MAPKYLPAPPVSGYRATLCTETDVRPMVDCVPASLVMMIDVWTQGSVRLLHQDLHRIAGADNLTYPGVTAAVASHAGLEVRFSEAFNANGTDPLTWGELLNRVSRGGAASVVGFYSRLKGHKSLAGRELIRHDPNLALSTTVRHAMTVSNFQKATATTPERIWLQDPMGVPPFKGEWVRPESVHAFIDKRSNVVGARVTAAVTPDPDKFPPDRPLEEVLKSMTAVANRRAVVKTGATPRSRPAFMGHDKDRFKLAPPLTTDRTDPLLGFVVGTNLTLADGTVLQRSTKWAVLHNRRWGTYFVHEQNLGAQTPIR